MADEGLWSILQPGPRNLEPSVRSQITMPTSPGSDGGGQAGSFPLLDSGGMGDFNPLYLGLLGGAMLTRREGEPAGLAERMVPYYLQQQAKGQERAYKQQLDERDAHELGIVEKTLSNAIEQSPGDFRKAAQIFGAQQLNLKSEAAAAARLRVLSTLKDKAIAQTAAANESAAFIKTFDQMSDNQTISGLAFAQQYLLNGGSTAKAGDIGKLFEQGVTKNEDGTLMLPNGKRVVVSAKVTPGSGGVPTREYVAGSLPGQGTERVVPGSPFEQKPGDSLKTINATGTGADVIAAQPAQITFSDSEKAGIAKLGSVYGVDENTLQAMLANPQTQQAALKLRTMMAEAGDQLTRDPRMTAEQYMLARSQNPAIKTAQINRLPSTSMLNDDGTINLAEQGKVPQPAGSPAEILLGETERKAAQAKLVSEAEAPSKIAVAAATGQNAMDRQIAMKKGQSIAERKDYAGIEGMYDTKTGKMVDLNQYKSEMEDQEPGRFRAITAEPMKAWRSAAGVERLLPFYELAAQNMTKTPGANAVQSFDFAVKNALGYAGVNTLVKGLEASKLILARAFQQSAQGLSDADRESVSGLAIKASDTAQQVRIKASLLKAFNSMVKAAAVGEDNLADLALVEFIQSPEWQTVTKGKGAKFGSPAAGTAPSGGTSGMSTSSGKGFR